MWCGDFFELPDHVWENVGGIYDRAALVALPKDVRRKYANETARRSRSRSEILLITFEYAEGALDGPPFSVLKNEVSEIYEQFEIQIIHSGKEEKFSKNHPKLHSVDLIETVYWINKQ